MPFLDAKICSFLQFDVFKAGRRIEPHFYSIFFFVFFRPPKKYRFIYFPTRPLIFIDTMRLPFLFLFPRFFLIVFSLFGSFFFNLKSVRAPEREKPPSEPNEPAPE